MNAERRDFWLSVAFAACVMLIGVGLMFVAMQAATR